MCGRRLDMFVEQKVFIGPPVLAVALTSFFAASDVSVVPTTGRRDSLKDSVSHVGPVVGTDAERKHPGPADYTVKHVNLQNNPSYTCRQRVKSSYPDSVTYDKVKNDNPGPGSYDLKGSVAIDTPSYSLRKRLEPVVDKERFPGPNAYISEKYSKPGAKRAPSFSMAKRLIHPNSMKSTPGPGEYYPCQPKTERGKYTMTKRPKGKGNFVNPAPNLYSLPEAISSKRKGVALKSRASPFVYSGFRTNKLSEPCRLPMLSH